MSEVVLYGREGCHLCDQARALIEALQIESRGELRLREVDIETDDELVLEYLERIPVVALDGIIISELVPDSQVLRSALLHTSPR